MNKERMKRLERDLIKEKKAFEKQQTKKLKAQPKLEKVKKTNKKIRISKTYSNIKKAYGYKGRLSSSLLNTGTGYTQGNTRNVQGPGRPKQVFIHNDPFTGKPIPAPLYYKRVRQYKRLQQQTANQQDLQAIQQLAKRGIPPEQAKQIVDNRQLQSAGQTQAEQVRQNMIMQQMRNQQIQRQPQQMQVQVQQNQQTSLPRPIWRRYNVQRYERDIFGNVKIVNSGNLPQNFWN